MTNTVQPYLKHQWDYIKQFILSPRTFGSLAPSSPWLCQRMITLADWRQVRTIAELGAADGVLTRHLLSQMTLDTTLDAYEIQPVLVSQLQIQADRDDRLNVVAQSAERLNLNYDLVFSCQPLLSIPVVPRLRILRQVRERLNPGGTLIQFQYSPRSEKLLSRYFEWKKVYEVRNFPPAWIYVCTPRGEPTR
ncbi:class I SAM-dependent methyltransferase [Yersinia intermedia]|uniref:class I SAM-dependent methyltransferase n=1 Tax=Yersinia intermedia TaxID=631 RepID=UPI000B6C989C|nr:methyltransferase [Yersinia intermedia]MCW8114230.1 methyltransferase [Yersinia intermedia]MDA5519001.1 methyltransferase [Yersinia intermedia]OWF90384.1 methyltransferase [Yersinia intermedia]